jgi:hydrogenase-4 component B
MVNILFVILAVSISAILFLNTKGKGFAGITTVLLLGIITGFYGLKSLTGPAYEILLSGTEIFGDVKLKIDSLSAWFILVINFTMITGAIYGIDYMKKYMHRKNEISIHTIAYILVHFSLLGICAVENTFVFLLLWEVLALAVFILVIFDHNDPAIIKAGINYLVQSHISIIFLMLGFIYYASKTNNYSFDAIALFSSGQSPFIGTLIFFMFFIGFALKAGFVPFHSWLPYAHPAAPTHVSGIMSGVVIKIGIFGIMRMLLLLKIDYSITGYIILAISVISGIYGVMLATIQHNLKKLLAYHSIENIGIIGIGIGVGCIGLGSTNKWMAILGFSGAMLHTLNHSLFKSLLFYSAGNVLQIAHTMNIEKLGGLIKKMPHTSFLFLIAALAICGLPPLNGFISEFLIYSGLYNWLYSADVISLIAIVFAMIGLVLIGGLALLCFTKAFSIVFLGTARSDLPESVTETGFWRLLPMYLTLSLMVAIGLFPSFFINALQQPVRLYTTGIVFNLNLIRIGALDSLQIINWLFIGFIILVMAIAGLRKLINRKRIIEVSSTWGCGYPVTGSRLQYTANSFVRSYAKIAKPALDIEKKEVEIDEVFPAKKHYETDSFDKIEKILIDKPLLMIEKIINKFLFLQNGHLQRYILYGIIFILAAICLPFLFYKFETIFQILKTL